jgi:hypothetical protein
MGVDMRIAAKGIVSAAAALLALVCGIENANAGLLGSSVTGTAYDPDLSTPIAGPIGPITVSSAVEFPIDTLPQNGSIDITNTQIIYTAASPGAYDTGSFDGFVFDFTGAPTILNVTQDAASGFNIAYSFTGNEVMMNFSGAASTKVGQETILDVTTASVPEIDPASAASGLMLLVGGLVVLRGRRQPLNAA